MVRLPKINKQQAIAMHAKGLTTREIASQAGCSHVWISKLINSAKQNKKDIGEYISVQADAIDYTKANVHQKINELVDIINVSEIDKRFRLPSLDILLRSFGILYDKSRLERGQSTSNVDVLAAATSTISKRMLRPDYIDVTPTE